jgi:F-type H+-transporting ATPase subunit b
MMRIARWALAAGIALAPAFAQHESAGHEGAKTEAGKSEGHGSGHESEGNLEIWKWANFLLLAGGIGYMIGKNAGPFFADRSKQIRKEMVEADEARREAEAKAALVDSKIANLQREIDELRAEARREQSAEEERIRQQTAADMAKIRQHAQQEIESAGKSARTELQRYSAELALRLAEQKIRARLTPETEDGLVADFTRDLPSN